jgi:hypothetical protein
LWCCGSARCTYSEYGCTKAFVARIAHRTIISSSPACQPSTLHEFSTYFFPLYSRNKSLRVKSDLLKKPNWLDFSSLASSLAALAALSTLHTLHFPDDMVGVDAPHTTHQRVHPKLHPNHGNEANNSTVELQELPKRAPQANQRTHLSSARSHANCKTGRLTGSRKAHHDTTLIGTVLSIVTCAAHDISQRI